MSHWNIGDIIDGVAKVLPPSAPALIHGSRVIPWPEFQSRTNALARGLVARGHKPGEKMALLLRNGPAYMEGTVASFKGRFVHVNVNYRYREEELHYIFDNADACIVIYGSEFAPLIEAILPRLPAVRTWLQVEVDDTPRPAFALDYKAFVESQPTSDLDIVRSPDDMLFLYTGGTTGMPKGVMWRQGDLRQVQLNPALMPVVPTSLAEHVDLVRTQGPGNRFIPACPQMHGTGLFSSIGVLCMGGSIITLEERNFDPVELWETAARQRATQVAIVGDAFAKPLLRALDDNRGRWDLSAMLLIVSSGVMWSQEVKQGLISHIPQVTLLDAFGASEAVGFAMSATTKEGEVATGKFMMGTDVAVFTPDRRRVTPGSGEPGFIARGGNIPLGYWKDPEKSAKTFPVIEGRRWSMPGDFCLLHEDGAITLLGRGSACINTAGEKVYPEEVEEALKQHPGVEDALVVGVPDEKWGSAVTAIVQKAPGASFTEDELRAHVRARLAGYKTPKRILEVHQMFRAPNGKADYRQATSFARSSLGLPL